MPDYPENENAVWATNGPFKMSAERGREVAEVASGGQTGIVGPLALEVRSTSTPGPQVEVLPGMFSIQGTPTGLTGYTSAPWQSYIRASQQTMTVPIQGTDSSGGRTDIIGIEINDPQYEGTTDSVDWATHEFWRIRVLTSQPNGRTLPHHFDLGRPFMPLARIRIPASTATITDDMIEDLRFMAVSRTHLQLLTYAVQSNRVLQPGLTHQVELARDVTIPQWATHMVIMGDLKGASVSRVPGSQASGVGARGWARPRVMVGSITQNPENDFRLERTRWGAWDVPHNTRIEIPMSGEWTIPEDRRGATFRINAQIDTDSGYDNVGLNAGATRFDLTLFFQETPGKRRDRAV